MGLLPSCEIEGETFGHVNDGEDIRSTNIGSVNPLLDEYLACSRLAWVAPKASSGESSGKWKENSVCAPGLLMSLLEAAVRIGIKDVRFGEKDCPVAKFTEALAGVGEGNRNGSRDDSRDGSGVLITTALRDELLRRIECSSSRIIF
jgi:hypothetical protein